MNAEDIEDSFQDFLDNHQYTRNGILRYERIFGDGFVSTGGLETTREFVALLDLQPGQRILDVGCGIGGGDIFMADTYGVEVLGVDLSHNMIDIARERYGDSHPGVTFALADMTRVEFPPASFDVIYSRDTLLHVADKEALFQKFLSWLKPGGKVLISDYCATSEPFSDAFQAYIADRQYHLLDLDTYGLLFVKAGFDKVYVQDRTAQFGRILESELERLESIKDDYISEFSEQDYREIVDGWNAKIERVSQGEQGWGLFQATKSIEQD